MSAPAEARHHRNLKRIEIAVLDRRIRIALPALRRVLDRVLADHGAAGTLSLAVVGDAAIRGLHREFLGIDTPTDVLSFPLAGPVGEAALPAPLLGEVILSAETAAREAGRRGLPPERELALYAVHGCLHLVGYDDLEAAGRARMRAAERRYLRLWEEVRFGAAGAPVSARSRSSRRRGARRPGRKPPPDRASPLPRARRSEGARSRGR